MATTVVYICARGVVPGWCGVATGPLRPLHQHKLRTANKIVTNSMDYVNDVSVFISFPVTIA